MLTIDKYTATAIRQALTFSASVGLECITTFHRCLVVVLTWGENSHRHTVTGTELSDEDAVKHPPEFLSCHYRDENDEKPYVIGMVYDRHSKTWGNHS